MQDTLIKSTSRRSFLGGILSIGAASLIVPTSTILAAPPVIVSDGVHDDWVGLQAAIDGKPFSVRDEATVMYRDGIVMIKGGNFCLGKPLVCRSEEFHLSDSRIVASEDFNGDAMLVFGCKHGVVSNNFIDLHRSRRLSAFAVDTSNQYSGFNFV